MASRLLQCFAVFVLACLSLSTYAGDVVSCARVPEAGEIALITGAPNTTTTPRAYKALDSTRLAGLSTSWTVTNHQRTVEGVTGLLLHLFSTKQMQGVPRIQQVPPTEFEPGDISAHGATSGSMDANILSKLGYGVAQTCTSSVVSDAATTDAVLLHDIANDDDTVESERQQYQRNPSAYAAAHPQWASDFQDNVAKWKLVLSNCFHPAATSPAYTALDIPARLGVISADGTEECLGYLISSDHILTARHCVFGAADVTTIYQQGNAMFTPVGAPDKHYQVCAAATSHAGLSTSLSDEQIVLRIAKVPQTVAAPVVFKADHILPLIEPGHLQMPTQLATFTFIPHASDFDSTYSNNLGIAAAPGCYVLDYDAKNACYTHFCPTYPGTSGSPMFTGSANSWSLVGVHIGTALTDDHLYGTCTAHAQSMENAGVNADGSLIAQFAKNGGNK